MIRIILYGNSYSDVLLDTIRDIPAGVYIDTIRWNGMFFDVEGCGETIAEYFRRPEWDTTTTEKWYDL